MDHMRRGRSKWAPPPSACRSRPLMSARGLCGSALWPFGRWARTQPSSFPKYRVSLSPAPPRAEAPSPRGRRLERLSEGFYNAIYSSLLPKEILGCPRRLSKESLAEILFYDKELTEDLESQTQLRLLQGLEGLPSNLIIRQSRTVVRPIGLGPDERP